MKISSVITLVALAGLISIIHPALALDTAAPPPGEKAAVTREIVTQNGASATGSAGAQILGRNFQSHPPMALAMAGDEVDLANGNSFFSFDSGAKSVGKTLIVPGSQDEKTLEGLEEDLKIMARVLDKALEQKAEAKTTRRVMGINVFGKSARNFRNLYLDGYGALFLLDVNFPLLPPPNKPVEKKTKDESSSTWEEAKNEVYGRTKKHDGDDEGKEFNVYKFVREEEPEYDESRVDDLKEALFDALKNAVHIRNLKPEESVTVVVSGTRGGGSRKVTTTRSTSPGQVRVETRLNSIVRFGEGSPAQGSTLVIRIKRSDLEAAAKDKDTAEIKKKARISIY